MNKSDDNTLFELFFHKSKEYYIDKLISYQKGQKFTFNVFAFLFGLFWFIYRKMYLQAFVILLIVVGEGFLEVLFFPDMDESTINTVNVVMTILIATITGFMGNYLYIKHAERVITNAQQKYNDTEQIHKIVKRKGGVSYLVFIILAGIIALIFLYNNFIP
ncbi:DUF2628 domain-containing protein [Bernardetia sp. Wsw4-3y2]|uniref:DUF2628 domain-containing protein n=1 Tax=Bernardetia sp. Wsw4-3y2 TaxID=3127471 RepID=UPI0030D2F0B1